MKEFCGRDLQLYKGTNEIKLCYICGEETDIQYDSMITHLVMVHEFEYRYDQKECNWTHYIVRQRVVR